MAWYFILFFTVTFFFAIKMIVSWIAGDMDIDIDGDGDIDTDVSSMFSFKGILHFLLGFSTYLSAVARFSPSYVPNETYQFTIAQYILGIVIGFVFMIILFYIYKSMMKLNHSSNTNPDIMNCECTVLTNLGNNNYKVLIKTHSGTITKILPSFENSDKIYIGEEYKVVIDEEGNYRISK